MRVQDIRAVLSAPAPGFVRMMRVDGRSGTPETWYKLPRPQDDVYPAPTQEWAAKGWQCAADAGSVHRWWPDDELQANLERGAKLRILEVPAHECVFTGTQYVFNPKAARDLLQ